MHAVPQNVRSTSNDKVSNGRLLPKTCDMRSAAGRRFRHLVQSYCAELGGTLSEVDQSLIRQAASLTLAAERLASDVVNGAPIDSDSLIRISGESRRILATLRGKADKRRATGPTALQEYLAARYGSEAEDDVEVDETP